MGLHNSSLTVGVALGAPLAGVVMDTWSPAWGFAAVGGVGLVVAALALPAELRRRREQPADGGGEQPADGGGEQPADQGREQPADEGAASVGGSADSLASGAAGPAVEFPSTDAAAPTH
jgi:MFS family permease